MSKIENILRIATGTPENTE